MKKLENKVAVITGATSGMGLATAKLFAEEGAYVFITGRRQEFLDNAVKEIGQNVTAVKADSSNLADLDRLYEIVKSKKGQIDILYANAGAGDFGVPFSAITEAVYAKTFGTNVKGTLFTIQKALPLMRDGGTIVMTGSIAGVKAVEGMGVYSASKAALRAFARTLTVELKTRKIRVNLMSPGSIDTAVFEGVPQQAKDSFASISPMGRLGRPEEIAKSVFFLASDDSSFITGIELFVDGGAAQV